MTTELYYLLLLAILNGLLWIPFVIGQVMSRGNPKPEDYKIAPTSELPHWVNRANRAHLNAVENSAPFAVVVIIATIIGFSNSVTATCAAVFFFARLAHAVIHISGFQHFMARTIAFVISVFAFMIYAIQLLLNA